MNYYKLSPEKQRELSLKRLIKYIQEYVYPYHPYLRRRYKEEKIDVNKLRTYEDFKRLPVISKADYREDPVSFILQPKFPGREIKYDTEKIHFKHIAKYIVQGLLNYPKDYSGLYRKMSFLEGKVGKRAAWEWFPIHFHASAGTTGDPTPAVYTYHDFKKIIPELASFILIEPDVITDNRPRMGWQTKNLNIFPGTPHLAFFQAVLTKFSVGMSSFDTCGGKVIPTERQIELLSTGEFNVVSAIPSYLTYWLRLAVEMKKKGKIGEMPFFEVAILGGEPVPSELKKYFKELAAELGAHPDFKVISSYGMTEMKWAFIECHDGSGVHLHPKFFFWEILNPETLEPVEDGEDGVVCFSHIGWRGTVFIRYNTGDLVKGGMQWKRCEECGYTYPILGGSICRAQKDFTKLKGTRVSFMDLINTIRNTYGVYNFQVVLTKEVKDDPFSRDRLKIRVVAETGANREKIENELKRNVKGTTEVTPDEIVFEEDKEKFENELFQRTGIKAEYIVDERPTHI